MRSGSEPLRLHAQHDCGHPAATCPSTSAQPAAPGPWCSTPAAMKPHVPVPIGEEGVRGSPSSGSRRRARVLDQLGGPSVERTTPMSEPKGRASSTGSAPLGVDAPRRSPAEPLLGAEVVQHPLVGHPELFRVSSERLALQPWRRPQRLVQDPRARRSSLRLAVRPPPRRASCRVGLPGRSRRRVPSGRQSFYRGVEFELVLVKTLRLGDGGERGAHTPIEIHGTVTRRSSRCGRRSSPTEQGSLCQRRRRARRRDGRRPVGRRCRPRRCSPVGARHDRERVLVHRPWRRSARLRRGPGRPASRWRPTGPSSRPTARSPCSSATCSATPPACVWTSRSQLSSSTICPPARRLCVATPDPGTAAGTTRSPRVTCSARSCGG
jgi:hypothetical protein